MVGYLASLWEYSSVTGKGAQFIWVLCQERNALFILIAPFVDEKLIAEKFTDGDAPEKSNVVVPPEVFTTILL